MEVTGSPHYMRSTEISLILLEKDCGLTLDDIKRKLFQRLIAQYHCRQLQSQLTHLNK